MDDKPTLVNDKPTYDENVVHTASSQGSKNDTDSKFVDLVEALRKIDTNNPMAKLNETTISDNNGGRITL